MDSYNSPTTKKIFRGTQVVWYIFGVLETLLIFRFLLKAAAANPAAGFSKFIYGITWPFTAPFNAVFGMTRVEGSSFEWTTLLAMAVYWIVAIGIIKIFLMSKTVSTPQAAAALDAQEKT